MHTIVAKLPLVYEAVILSQPAIFSNIDWELSIWRRILESWDRESNVWGGLARILIHVSTEDAKSIFLRHHNRYKERGWEPPVAVALAMKLPVEKRSTVLSREMMNELASSFDHSKRQISNVEFVISKWSGSLAFDVLRFSLEMFSALRANPNTRHQYEPFFYETWLCLVADGITSDFVVDAWTMVNKHDARWYASPDWHRVCLILINHLDKNDESSVEIIWNDIQRLEQEHSYSTGGYQDAIASKLPKRVLQSLIQKIPDDKVTLPDDIFTCPMHKYIQNGGVEIKAELERLNYRKQYPHDDTSSEQFLTAVQSLLRLVPAYLSYIIVPLGYMAFRTSVITSPIIRLSGIIMIILLIPIALLFEMLNRLAKALNTPKAVLDVLSSPFVFLSGIWKIVRSLIAGIVSPSSAIAKTHSLKQEQANQAFESLLRETSAYEFASHRPLLQRIGGRTLRKLTAEAYRDAQSWWRNAVTRTQ